MAACTHVCVCLSPFIYSPDPEGWGGAQEKWDLGAKSSGFLFSLSTINQGGDLGPLSLSVPLFHHCTMPASLKVSAQSGNDCPQ